MPPVREGLLFRTDIRTLAFMFLVAGFVVRLTAAIMLPNVHRPDEVFQTLEPAFHLQTGGGIVTWEWRYGIRSPLFPGFIAGILWLAQVLHLSPGAAINLVHVALAIISSATAWIGCRIGWLKLRWMGALLCGTLCALWPDLVYFGPKTLTEIQAANLLIIALYIGVYASADSSTLHPIDRNALSRVAICGLLLGTAFVLRFPLAVAIAIVAAFACRFDRRRWLVLILTFIVPVILSGLVDRLYWGSWFQSIWLNYQMNLTQHVSEEYGVEGRFFFFQELFRTWGLLSIPVVIFALLGTKRAPVLGLIVAAVVLPHSLVAHKEISFIYAALPPLIVLTGLGAAELLRLTQFARHNAQKVTVGGVGVCVAAVLAIAVSGHYRSRWTASAGFLRAAQIIAADPKACGIALQLDAVNWYKTGGDVFLGRDLPYYPYRTKSGLELALPASNYALTGASQSDLIPGFDVLGCWPSHPNGVCLSKSAAPHACVADRSFDLNSVKDLGRLHEDYGPRR